MNLPQENISQEGISRNSIPASAFFTGLSYGEHFGLSGLLEYFPCSRSTNAQDFLDMAYLQNGGYALEMSFRNTALSI